MLHCGMKVPQTEYLHSQTFNSQKFEFVWRLDENQKQIIFGVNKNGSTYIEAGRVNSAGDYTDKPLWKGFSPKSESLKDHNFWHWNSSDNLSDYDYFSNGVELYGLAEEVVSYLNEK
jgi:hypothetical protein